MQPMPSRSAFSRRHFLQSTAAFGAAALSPATTVYAGQFTGRIRKSLKWGMAHKAAQGMTLTEAFKKLRCLRL
jgi:hypothetical protein